MKMQSPPADARAFSRPPIKKKGPGNEVVYWYDNYTNTNA